MTCPKCGIENPPSAEYCDCGYEFVAGSKPTKAEQTQVPGISCPKCKTASLDPTAKFCNNCGGSMKKRSSSPVLMGCGCVSLMIGALMIVGLFSSGGEKRAISSQKPTRTASNETPTQTPSPTAISKRLPTPTFTPEREQDPTVRVSMTKMSWEKGGFDTVMLGTFTIENRNAFDVKDIRVRCELTANSGTVLGNVEEVIYDRINANKSKTFSKVNMGFIRAQSATASCTIKRAERTD